MKEEEKILEELLIRREKLGETLIFDHNFYRETIFTRLKEENEYKPFINLPFYILTKNNEIKIAYKTVDILMCGIADLHGELINFCFDHNYKLIGVGSSKYDLDYFKQHLKMKGIDYTFEKDDKGKIKLYI